MTIVSEFKWHDMRKERPKLGHGNYIIVGSNGGMYFARRFEGYGNIAWFRDTRGNHHYPEKVQAWYEVPKYEGVTDEKEEAQGAATM